MEPERSLANTTRPLAPRMTAPAGAEVKTRAPSRANRVTRQVMARAVRMSSPRLRADVPSRGSGRERGVYRVPADTGRGTGDSVGVVGRVGPATYNLCRGSRNARFPPSRGTEPHPARGGPHDRRPR